MTITLRSTKGSELSFAELDGNFTDLDGRITALPDSSQVAGIITAQVDSAYVQARQVDVRDSAFITAIVDSAYIQLRDRFRDSSFISDIVDSSYVQARETTHKSFYKYFYTADSNQTIFTGNDLQSNSLSYDSSTIQVYKNGFLLNDLYDFTLSGGNTVTLTMGMDSGHDLIITTWK